MPRYQIAQKPFETFFGRFLPLWRRREIREASKIEDLFGYANHLAEQGSFIDNRTGSANLVRQHGNDSRVVRVYREGGLSWGVDEKIPAAPYSQERVNAWDAYHSGRICKRHLAIRIKRLKK